MYNVIYHISLNNSSWLITLHLYFLQPYPAVTRQRANLRFLPLPDYAGDLAIWASSTSDGVHTSINVETFDTVDKIESEQPTPSTTGVNLGH